MFLKFAPLMLLGLAAAATDGDSKLSLVAHEWGTFTSVAGIDGSAIPWAPLAGKPDLPCFVNRLGRQNFKMNQATVRMETPVLYFYTPRQLTLSVHVTFPKGWITEWYPKVTRIDPTFGPGSSASVDSYSGGKASWENVEAWPGEDPQFPTGKGASRYYAARHTDSAALHINGEREKMIFYRGVGDFPIPLTTTFGADANLEISNSGSEPIPMVIFFDNREGRIGYRVTRGLKNSVKVNPPELTGSLNLLRQQMSDTLIEFGLYRKEALAMLETWDDSWFEHGTRLIYIVPRSQVDRILPLTITPLPAATARVFIGRIELLAPWVRQTIATALAQGNVALLASYGRFLQPFLQEMRSELLPQAGSTTSYLNLAYQQIQQDFNHPSCVE